MPILIVLSCTNHHDATKFINVMECISEYLDDDTICSIVSVYADKGYDAYSIRDYLKNRNIITCIPYRNYKKNNEIENNFTADNYKTRFVVERFFAWLKNRLHRTRIRYERNAENYLAFVYLASIMMYWRVLG